MHKSNIHCASFWNSLLIALCVCLMLVGPVSAAPVPSLGSAEDYAVLAIGGTSNSNRTELSVYQSNTVIDGNVGAGPFTVWGHDIDATVNGRVDYDFSDSPPSVSGKGTVTGGVNQRNMSGPVNDALAASAAFAALTPTQTFSSLSENQVIVGNGALDVIRVTGMVALKQGLTLEGNSSDFFVFQLTTGASGHVLTLSGMTMTLLGGVTADHIVWSLAGKGGDIVINAGAKVYGTFLAPYRNITVDHGDITGRVIGGGNGGFVKVHSSSHIVTPTTNQ